MKLIRDTGTKAAKKNGQSVADSICAARHGGGNVEAALPLLIKRIISIIGMFWEAPEYQCFEMEFGDNLYLD